MELTGQIRWVHTIQSENILNQRSMYLPLVSIKINQSLSMTTKHLILDLSSNYVKESLDCPITGRSEHIDQRDSGDFNYPQLLADMYIK